MSPTDFAFAVRSGEHACCSFEDSGDRDRLTAGFVRAGLARGHKVLCLTNRSSADEALARLRGVHSTIHAALESGQLVVRDPVGAYAPDGSFDVERMLDAVRDEHARALAEGYTGLSMTGDVGAGLHDAVGSQRLAEYERRLDEEILGGTRLLLCQYDHPELDDETMSQATGAHHVDVPPELAAIGRAGMLAAARARSPETVRLAGELDFESAVTVAEALAATFEGPRRVDLADLNYIDVTGMRALRGRAGEALTITPASEPVCRLVGLLGWDTDPDVRVGA